MLAILREISIACFFTSYLVVLVLELLRLWGRIPGRGLLLVDSDNEAKVGLVLARWGRQRTLVIGQDEAAAGGARDIRIEGSRVEDDQ